MKIQNKSDVTQSIKQSDTSSAPSTSQTDFFSELIAEMLSPAMMQQSSQFEGGKTAEGNVNEQENQEVISEMMADSALPSANGQYDALREKMNLTALKDLSLQNAPTLAMQSTEVKAQVENALLANQAMSVKTNTQVNVQTGSSALLSQAYLDQENKSEAISKLLTSESTQEWVYDEEETQALDLTFPLEKIVKKENSEKMSSSLDPLKMLTDNTRSTETFATMFKSQKGLVNYEVAETNQFVAKLIDIGNLVAPQLTSPAQTSEHQLTNLVQRSANLTEPAFTQSKITQPEYELKIDLFSSTNDPLAKDTYHASIKIYPPELGAMLAKLKVGKGGAELTILTDNNRIKEIVESNLTQLKENFREADINLIKIQVDVQQQASSGSGQQNQNQNTAESLQAQQGIESNKVIASAPATPNVDALVDTYA